MNAIFYIEDLMKSLTSSFQGWVLYSMRKTKQALGVLIGSRLAAVCFPYLLS